MAHDRKLQKVHTRQGEQKTGIMTTVK